MRNGGCIHLEIMSQAGCRKDQSGPCWIATDLHGSARYTRSDYCNGFDDRLAHELSALG